MINSKNITSSTPEYYIKIKSLVEYYLYNTPSDEDIEEYIQINFLSISESSLASDFIKKTIEISNGTVYSSNYFDCFFIADSLIKHSLKEEYLFLKDLLKETFFHVLREKSIVHMRATGIYNLQNDLSSFEFKNVITDFHCKSLYEDINTVSSSVESELNNLANHIEYVISGLEIADLYELLSYTPNEPSSPHSLFRFESRNNGSENSSFRPDISSIKAQLEEYITRRAKLELAERVKKASESTISQDIFHDLLSCPVWFDYSSNIISDEIKRQILWAWNYILLHKPDELELNEKTQEQYAFVHLVDVLPALEDYYKNKYRSYEKKYYNPKRKHFFSDQTAIYNANHFISSEDFLVDKKHELTTSTLIEF